MFEKFGKLSRSIETWKTRRKLFFISNVVSDNYRNCIFYIDSLQRKLSVKFRLHDLIFCLSFRWQTWTILMNGLRDQIINLKYYFSVSLKLLRLGRRKIRAGLYFYFSMHRLIHLDELNPNMYSKYWKNSVFMTKIEKNREISISITVHHHKIIIIAVLLQNNL